MPFGNTGEGPPEDPECGRPLDLSALRADDALLDALGAGLIRPDEPYSDGAESDRELVAMLAAWVAQVRPEDVEPETIPVQTVPAQPVAARPRPSLAAVPQPAAVLPIPAAVPDRRSGVLSHFGRRLAVAALLAGLASSSVAFGIAGPGSDAPAVARVAYAERARSIAAATQVTEDLQTARGALEQGHREDAARLIAAIGDQLPAVREDDGRARLDDDRRRLQQVLAASGGPPAAGDLVLAADAPSVEPSDFLVDLADDNDILVGDVPPSGGTGDNAPPPDPADTILASGSPPPAAAGPTGVDAGTGSATAAGSSDGPAPAAGDQTSGPDTTGDAPASDSAGGGSSSSSDAPSSDNASTSETSSTGTSSTETSTETSAEEPANQDTTSEQPPTTSASTSSAPSSSERPPSNPARPATPAEPGSAANPAGAAGDGQTSTSRRPAGQTPSGRQPGAAAGSAAGGDVASRVRTSSPRSRDFIGPVTERSTPPPTRTGSRSGRTSAEQASSAAGPTTDGNG